MIENLLDNQHKINNSLVCFSLHCRAYCRYHWNRYITNTFIIKGFWLQLGPRLASGAEEHQNCLHISPPKPRHVKLPGQGVKQSLQPDRFHWCNQSVIKVDFFLRAVAPTFPTCPDLLRLILPKQSSDRPLRPLQHLKWWGKVGPPEPPRGKC